ncbi:MAG: NAD-dependent epimerase [Caulobacterales bacterium 68-7]|nr:MAG: NAD-dependent epimerase [Caulobacterales bacterium 68-7]
MKILIIGAAGMIGRKLTDALCAPGRWQGPAITALRLADVIEAPLPAGAPEDTVSLVSDLSAPGAAEALVAERPDCIFHLAAIVSSDAEANFDKGYRVNFDGTRALFEAIRAEGEKTPYRPRLVFTSSLAVFGSPLPDTIPDDYPTAPLTSYGAQKAMAELLLGDYSRRGFFDGIGIRLPTICIRPGVPNKAASGFYSSILREPLQGKEAVLPVEESLRHWFASPRAAVGFLLHAGVIDLAKVGPRRTLNMPGVSATVGEEIEALKRFAGPEAAKLIRREPDPAIDAIVQTWAQRFDPQRALALGFRADASLDEIIKVFLEDELGR